MKIRLDECISNRVALAVLQITANREGYEVSFVRHGHGGPDPDWIRKFAEEGGTAIVSGDHDILQHWPNLIAYTESGLISFFPPKAYEHLKGFGRASFILRWWPAIVEKVKISAKGDRWRLPMQWTQIDPTKMEPLKDPRIDGTEPLSEGPEKPYVEPKQEDFPFDLGTLHACRECCGQERAEASTSGQDQTQVKVPLMGLLRTIFWFESGELSEIRGKFTARKWGYETRWEADVLVPLVAFVLFAFIISVWLGILSVWAFKEAVRALNKKGFFDPLP